MPSTTTSASPSSTTSSTTSTTSFSPSSTCSPNSGISSAATCATTGALSDITSSLDAVQGGGAGRVLVNGARAAWNAARPWLGRADNAVETFGKYAGAALAAKEGYDLVRGGDRTSPASTPASPSAPPAGE